MEALVQRIYDGREQIVLRDGEIEAHIAPDKGGRIIQMKKGDVEALYRLYPNYAQFGPYLEYGGIEYLMGSAPGSIYDRRFEFEIQGDEVRLWCFSRDILFEKVVTLKEPFLDARYTFVNLGERFIRFTFSIHPEIAIGDFKDCLFTGWSGSGEEKEEYRGPGNRRFYKPKENHYTVTNKRKGVCFVAMFPTDVIDRVELYYPRIDTHLCPQLMVDSVGLCPHKKASYSVKFGMVKPGSADLSEAAKSFQGSAAYTSI